MSLTGAFFTADAGAAGPTPRVGALCLETFALVVVCWPVSVMKDYGYLSAAAVILLMSAIVV